MGIHVTPIPSTIVLAAPAFTLGTTNSAGPALTSISSDSTLQMFDTTVPTTIAYGASAAAGSVALMSHRDHVHGMVPDPAQALAKAWARVDSSNAVVDSFNVASISNDGTGTFTVTFDTDFANANYAVAGICGQDTVNVTIGSSSSQGTGSCVMIFRRRSDGALTGLASQCVFFGDQ